MGFLSPFSLDLVKEASVREKATEVKVPIEQAMLTVVEDGPQTIDYDTQNTVIIVEEKKYQLKNAA